jgi:diguanylate cyclase (GGDEF)-like protein
MNSPPEAVQGAAAAARAAPSPSASGAPPGGRAANESALGPPSTLQPPAADSDTDEATAPLAHAGRLSVRDLRRQLLLGCGCFVLMLASLLLALYAMRVDNRLNAGYEQALGDAARALHLQQRLADWRALQADALRRGERPAGDLARAAALRAEAAELAALSAPAAVESRQRLLAALDALADTQRDAETALTAGRGSAALAAWQAAGDPPWRAAEGALRDLLAAHQRTLAAGQARADEVGGFARHVLLGASLLTVLLGLLFGVLAWRSVAAHRRLFGRLDQLAHTDGLTGVLNRRGLDERLPVEIARADRLGYPFTLVMLDLDHFKRYNDRRGHAAGDTLLRSTAQAWRRQLRPTDLLARYGGEEFTLVLPACDAEHAIQLVDRLRPLMPDRQTFSAGIATRVAPEDAAELLRRADAALLYAKRSGRNKSVVAGTEPQIALPLRSA